MANGFQLEICSLPFAISNRLFLFPVPYSLFPIPCSLFPVPYSLFPSFEPPTELQFHPEDSVRIAHADERDVFTDRPFKLDDLVL